VRWIPAQATKKRRGGAGGGAGPVEIGTIIAALRKRGLTPHDIELMTPGQAFAELNDYEAADVDAARRVSSDRILDQVRCKYGFTIAEMRELSTDRICDYVREFCDAEIKLWMFVPLLEAYLNDHENSE
jgi:hypothetical protein